ncbi:MAG: rhodanese-like domain-containing protein [Pyrinomonadaceae bacterium]
MNQKEHWENVYKTKAHDEVSWFREQLERAMRYLAIISLSIVLVTLVACQSASTKNASSGVPNVTTEIREVSPNDAQQAVSKAYSQFIDVRTPEEYAGGHAARAENVPLDTLTASFDKLEKNEPVYIICQTGNRSKKAAEILREAGYKNVLNVTGGTVAWQAAGLPIETKPPHVAPQSK